MRIGFLVWRELDHPRAGGSEVLVDHLATGLVERGHEVTMVSGAPVGERAYRTVDGGGTLDQFVRSPLNHARHLRDHDLVVDVVNGMAFFTPLWRRGASLCLVNHVHTEHWAQWFTPPVAAFGRALEAKAVPRAYRGNLFVAVSPSTAAALAELGVPEGDVRIVYNGVDLPDGPPLPTAPEPTFVALGRLVPHKRCDLLVRAWAKVQPTTGGRLVIAGEGPEADAIEALGVPGVELVGKVTEEEKHRLLSEAWALLHPASVEGWGLVVMEAAARATPTIGFWAPGVRDSVVHDETGLLVETEDELVARWLQLAADEELRFKLGTGARRRAEEFTWEQTVAGFEAVAEEAVERARERRRYSKLEVLKLFRAEKHDPEPFYERLAEKAANEFSLPLAGKRILDLGCGPGHYTKALRDVGAQVVPAELARESLRSSTGELLSGATLSDATQLPFPDGSFDGVFCSNMLEHTPSTAPVFEELERVLRPGGWAWISWTNWYSPWGGHEIVPFHYLGPDKGLAVWRRLYGEPRKNVPYEALWPTYVGRVLKELRSRPGLRLVDAMPRYWPSQRWILKVPGLREVITWNCVLVVEKPAAP
jgi:glycosyltransferase involved in cell wall biosynthesis/SAM-dependent methyltransferase